MEEAFYEGLWTHWTCCACGDMNEAEGDARGEGVTCEGCEKEQIIPYGA